MDLLIGNDEELSTVNTRNINTSNFYENNFISSNNKEQMFSNDDLLVICDQKNVGSSVPIQTDFYRNASICNNTAHPIIFQNDDISSGRVSALTEPLAYTSTSFNLSSADTTPFTNHIDLSSDQNSTLQHHLSEENGEFTEEVEFTLSTVVIPTTGIGLYILSLLTFVGNAMVLHAIRTDKRLQTVSWSCYCNIYLSYYFLMYKLCNCSL